jgi:hypothetical protein
MLQVAGKQSSNTRQDTFPISVQMSFMYPTRHSILHTSTPKHNGGPRSKSRIGPTLGTVPKSLFFHCLLSQIRSSLHNFSRMSSMFKC